MLGATFNYLNAKQANEKLHQTGFFFYVLILFMWLCVYHACAGIQRDQKRAANPQGLELAAIMNLIWMMGTELASWGAAATGTADH